VELEPRIGSFEMQAVLLSYSAEAGLKSEVNQVGVREIDFLTENNTPLWFNNSPVKGMYTAADPSQLKLEGTFESPQGSEV